MLSSLWRRLRTKYSPSQPDPLYSAGIRRDPYPYYEHLRGSAPIHFIPGKRVWVVSRCEHVQEVLSQPDIYLSSNMQGVEASLQGADDPGHSRVRKIAARAFNAKQLAALESDIRTLTIGFVDAIVLRGRCEFIGDLAKPLPLQVIAMVLGFDPKQWRQLDRWSEAAIADGFAGFEPNRQASIATDLEELNAFLENHLEKCRSGSVGGVFSSEVIPDLTDKEALDVLRILLAAGGITTEHLLGSMMVELLRHPDLLQTLRDNPSLIPAMVEETLRINGPSLSVTRRVAKDVRLGGKTIPANDALFLLLGSANHSEDRFANADQFNLSRSQRHFAFGHGIHFCMGAALSRLEARIFLETLVESQVTIEPVHPIEKIEWNQHTHLRDPRRLEVRLCPLERAPSPASVPRAPNTGCPHH